jgi:hypothetical protein
MPKGEEERKDVIINVPAAVRFPQKAQLTGLTPQDEIAWLRGELRRSEAECREQQIAAETICQTAVCLIRAVQLATGAREETPVQISSELFNRMYNTRIHIRGDGDGNLHCSFTDRTNELFTVEGRTL